MNQKQVGIIFLVGVVVVFVFLFVGRWQQDSAIQKANEEAMAKASAAAAASPTSLSQKPSTQPAAAADQKQIKQYKSFPLLKPDQLANRVATISTAKGDIKFSLYPEATMAASNFVFLANDGFYDNLTFHRVEPKFVIQGGDPLGTGQGGPGYKFADEKVTRKYTKGTVAMANSGPNTNGSQFFIMLDDHPELPPNYTIFGKVTSGIDVVLGITKGDVMTKVRVE